MTDSNIGLKILDRISLPYIVLFWAVVTWYTITLEISRPMFAVIILGGSIVAYAIEEIREGFREEENYFDAALLVAIALYTIGMTGYILLNFEQLFFVRVGYALWYEYVMAAVMILIIMYLTYREFGLAFTGVVLTVIVYARWGNYFPGLLNHGGFSWTRILLASSLDFAGIYGSLTQLVAAWIAMLMLFAGLFRAYGAFDAIKRIALRARSVFRSGAAQAAVIASLIIGMITGAAVANAAMTGSFTIPLMKKDGIKSKTAAGIEAVASAGGQIMPPVMAATAFVMAALLSISYVDVLIAGIIPALIFYVSVAAGVHYRAVSQQTPIEELENGGDSDSSVFEQEDKSRSDLIADAVKFGVPFAVLIWALGIARLTVSTAGLYASATMVLFGVGVPVGRKAITNGTVAEPLSEGLRQTADGLEYGLKLFAPIMIIVAVVNGIVDLLNATGMPGVFSLYILQFAGGIVLIGIILAMIICIILGMGMPTVAAYTIVALLVAPTLTGEYGIPVLAAHFFVFYSAMLSGITPPIAMNVIVTTGIADSDFWASAFEAVRIAITLFVLPFAFIYNPEIITNPFSPAAIYSAGLLLVGALSLVHGLNYNVNNMNVGLAYVLRIIYIAFGVIAMVYPGELLRSVAAVGFIVLLIAQYMTWEIHQPQSESVKRI